MKQRADYSDDEVSRAIQCLEHTAKAIRLVAPDHPIMKEALKEIDKLLLDSK